MHIVAIAWIFVVVLMALAEGTATNGSWLGALVTLLMYGVLPLSLVLYLMGTPARRRAQRRRSPEPHVPLASAEPHGGGLAAGDPVAPVREEP